jgi:hypothetical protein
MAVSAFGQTVPCSVTGEVNVVVINGSGNSTYDTRILAAFQKSVVDAGFKLGNDSSPYTLEVTFALREEQMNTPNNKFIRYDISANFTDTATRQTLFPIYAISQRHGHFTLAAAQNRAVADAERKINEEYKNFLESYFPE